jgi:hypothetical protein
MRIKTNKGSSIIENVVALAVFSGACLFLMHLLVTTLLHYSSKRTFQAISIASKELENAILTKNFSSESYAQENWIIHRIAKIREEKVFINIRIFYKEETSAKADLNIVTILNPASR